MSLDHKIDQIETVESGAPSVRTAADMIIIYDNPEPSEIGSEFYFHGHTLVSLIPGFHYEEQLKNEAALKELEFALQLIDESSTKKKFQKNYGGEITELHSVFSELQQIIEDLTQSSEPTPEHLKQMGLLKAQLSEFIDRNKQEALITYQKPGTEEQKLVITNLKKIQTIVSMLEKVTSKYSAYLSTPNEHNKTVFKVSLESFKNAIVDIISDIQLYQKFITSGFDPLSQTETSSSREVEDKMEIIIQSIFPALEVVKKDLEKKIKQTQKLKRSLEAQKQDTFAQTEEIVEAEQKLNRIAPLFGNEELNKIRESIRQKQDQLTNAASQRIKQQIELNVASLKLGLIFYYVSLFNESLASEISITGLEPVIEPLQHQSVLHGYLRELERQLHDSVSSKTQKFKGAQNQLIKHQLMLGLPKDISMSILANVRYGEVFLPVEVAVEQNLYLSTWSSENKRKEIYSLKEKLPKQIITANCMLSGSLEGVTKKGVRFQLIDHNLDVCLTDGDGVKIQEIIHDPHLSPYEISMFIQFEHELLWIRNLYQDQPKPVVRYHLPGSDYMLSGLRYVLSGDISLHRNNLAKYCKAVKERMLAHKNAITQIAHNTGIEVIIESPLDNLGDMYDFMRKYLFPSLDDIDMSASDDEDSEDSEENLVNLILQTLATNYPGTVHQRAWAAVLPENIVAARQNPIWSEKLPKTIKELLYLANSMEFAFASIDCNTGVGSADAPFKEDYNVLALHSTDESPIAKNCIDPKFNLVEKFGHLMAVFVQPRELYDGGAKSNNPFRMDLATANAVREEFLAEVIRKRNPSEVLKSIICADIHQLKEPHQSASERADVLTVPVMDNPTVIGINPAAPGGSGMFAAPRIENSAPAAPETSFKPMRPTPAIYAQ